MNKNILDILIARNLGLTLNRVKEALKFDNLTLRELPVDPIDINYPRSVAALQSRVKPTPLKNPRLVCWSDAAAESIGIDKYELELNPLFIDAIAGNFVIPGSEPVAHNYCGHQFGSFAGQLGDGAAITLGEIIVNCDKNGKNTNATTPPIAGDEIKRCFIQVKGAGPTPYSRTADGRKVLRSSIREFLCSEAMHHLGIPTTRALCVIKSDDTIGRDMFYDGNEKQENCAVVCRLAETFFRFGTFQLFNFLDPETMRSGPCVGMNDFKKKLLDFTIAHYFKNMKTEERPLGQDVVDQYSEIEGETLQRYARFFREVIRDSSRLVLMWESVGFCHGVLNTDNMSIKGLTIDYGPFCFIERFDRQTVPNTSDGTGRYSYSKQKKTFQWNLYRLAEALDPLLPLAISKELIKQHFMKGYSEGIHYFWFQKLGLLIEKPDPEEWCEEMFLNIDDIIRTFLSTMEKTFSDFTNTVRSMNSLILPGLPGHEESKTALLDSLIESSSDLKTVLAQIKKHVENPETVFCLQMIDSKDPVDKILIEKMNMNTEVYSEIRDRYNELSAMTEESRHQECINLWTNWVGKYCEYLKKHYGRRGEAHLHKISVQRRELMDRLNPKFILRNHVMQKAIDAAEKDDFRWTRLLLSLAENSTYDIELSEARETIPELSSEEYESLFKPDDSAKIRVSCSS